MNVFDTIAAVSTPRGKGGIAVIRISGPDAISVGSKVFLPKNKKKLSEIESNREVYGDICAKEDGKYFNIDDGMGVVFRGPNSFTGEDTVEISCHGGILITQTVLEAVFAAGARPAMAGEFTRRAFVSGRMTLTEAQSLGELLEAKTHRQLLMSRAGVNGALSKEIEKLYSGISSVLTSIYAKIDFPDEDLAEMSKDEIEEKLTELSTEAKKLSKTYKTGKAVNEGIKTVICGRTNAGKSSLYNLIVGREAAIVTDIEGTTRDLLEETVPFGNVTLRLCDTAGIRDTEDKVESIGVERARQQIKDAELVLALFDGSRKVDFADEEFIKELAKSEACVLTIVNKSDKFEGESEICKLLNENGFDNQIIMSTVSGEGCDALKNEIDKRFIDGSIDIRYDAVIADARQYAAILKATESLDAALSGLHEGYALDLCCIDAEEAMATLGEINGRNVNDDIVASIFSKFCVGK